MDNTSGVGVLDKAALVLTALEQGPTTLAGLVQATGLARPTAHRLAVALSVVGALAIGTLSACSSTSAPTDEEKSALEAWGDEVMAAARALSVELGAPVS